jgi:hypothetical protein
MTHKEEWEHSECAVPVRLRTMVKTARGSAKTGAHLSLKICDPARSWGGVDPVNGIGDAKGNESNPGHEGALHDSPQNSHVATTVTHRDAAVLPALQRTVSSRRIRHSLPANTHQTYPIDPNMDAVMTLLSRNINQPQADNRAYRRNSISCA